MALIQLDADEWRPSLPAATPVDRDPIKGSSTVAPGLGLIAGFIASKVVNKTGEGLILDIVLGIVGSVVGGFLFSLIGAAPVDGFNIYSMFVAVIGAVVVLVAYHAITGGRAR